MAAWLFGTLGYLSRVTGGMGLESLPWVIWRAGIAAIVLAGLSAALYAIRRDRAGGLWSRLAAVPRRRLLGLAVASLLGASLNVAVFAAFERTAIAVALICFYTFPAIVTVLAVPLYGDRLDGRRLLALAMSSAGLLLVVLSPALGSSGGLQVDILGVALSLFAAGCQAGFVLIAGRGFRPLSSLDVSTIVVGSAVVLSIALLAVVGGLAGLALPLADGRLWPWVVAGGVAGAAIPTTAFVAGIGLIGPARAAILMTFEPLVGVTLAALLLGETPVPLQLVGGAAVLAAAVILQRAPGPAPEEAESRLV